MRIIIGLIGIILSFLLLIYRVQVKAFFGEFRWAEEKIGPGGTYLVLLLAALFGFIFSITYMTNSFDLFLGGSKVDFFKTTQ